MKATRIAASVVGSIWIISGCSGVVVDEEPFDVATVESAASSTFSFNNYANSNHLLVDIDPGSGTTWKKVDCKTGSLVDKISGKQIWYEQKRRLRCAYMNGSSLKKQKLDCDDGNVAADCKVGDISLFSKGTTWHSICTDGNHVKCALQNGGYIYQVSDLKYCLALDSDGKLVVKKKVQGNTSNCRQVKMTQYIWKEPV
jgi:hypothetical protein